MKEQTQFQLIAHIRKIIDKCSGFIDFAKFMELALYTPKLGYYNASKHKIGEEGDFVTSPEISNLFGKSIARQIQQVLKQLHGADMLEIGAGTGKLACDLLKELEQLNSLPSHYYILEISPDLRDQQAAALLKECPHLAGQVIWLDKFPNDFRGVIFANELLDAFPVHRFKIENDDVKELSVSYKNQFEWVSVDAPFSLKKQVNKLKEEYELPNNYESEINLGLPAWFDEITNCLAEGIILLIDYGYGSREFYHPDRMKGTLMCYHQHTQNDNPLINVGLQDITAHVDFSYVVELATERGLDLLGYTTQSAFLLACGILEISENAFASEVERYQQNHAIKTLTLPSQMGEAIKVMALGKHFPHDLIGFNLHDRSRDL